LTGVDLGHQKVGTFHATACVFDECDLSALQASAGSMSNGPVPTVWRCCRFDGVDLRGVLPGRARFEACTFTAPRLDQWLCMSADFVDCVFTGELREVLFSGHPVTIPGVAGVAGAPRRNEFHGNDFSAALLHHVEFVNGIDLSRQRLPAGPAYLVVGDAPAAVARAQTSVASWPPDDREAATRMLHELTTRGYDEQQEIFAQRDWPGFVPDAIRSRVWGLLSGAA
jgi:hypothetical protein